MMASSNCEKSKPDGFRPQSSAESEFQQLWGVFFKNDSRRAGESLVTIGCKNVTLLATPHF